MRASKDRAPTGWDYVVAKIPNGYGRELAASALAYFVFVYGPLVRFIPLEFAYFLREFPGVAAPILLLAPLIFHLLLGFYPLSRVIRRFAGSISLLREEAKEAVLVKEKTVEPQSAKDLLRRLVTQSNQLSVKLFNRAAVYMVVGVAVAFMGLAVFWMLSDEAVPLPSGETISRWDRLWERIPSMAARFGILFFIESIAFFFLRQYRVAMDEFRYFHQLARMREDTLAVVTLAAERNDSLDFDKLVSASGLFREPARLQQGETTELLQATKGWDSDLQLIQQLLGIVGERVKSVKTG